jgi:AbrB family looped-hinge helix DNA binding protein
MAEAKLSSKNQIVIPREAREALRIKPGNKILVVVLGDEVVVLKKPRSYRAAITGIAPAGMYPPDHIEKERNSWD